MGTNESINVLLAHEPSDLPKFSLSFDYAFSNSGVAGPLYIKDIYGKNDQIFKSYIFFTWATTRNVHLELTPSMDASDVIKALVRFLSRRGCIKMFISDNFSSFRFNEVSKFLLQYIMLIGNLFYLYLHGFYERLERLKALYERYQEDQS